MSHIVVTTTGTLYAGRRTSMKGDKTPAPLTEAEAEARCAAANANAKRLGIQTRYEVREA